MKSLGVAVDKRRVLLLFVGNLFAFLRIEVVLLHEIILRLVILAGIYMAQGAAVTG
jgi:hypothetical protein